MKATNDAYAIVVDEGEFFSLRLGKESGGEWPLRWLKFYSVKDAKAYAIVVQGVPADRITQA